jgi:hypothetical protein
LGNAGIPIAAGGLEIVVVYTSAQVTVTALNRAAALGLAISRRTMCLSVGPSGICQPDSEGNAVKEVLEKA